MENLIKYLQEALVNHKIKKQKYKYHPLTKEELIKCIKSELYNDNMDLNCIDTSEINDMCFLFGQLKGVVSSDEHIKLTDEQQKILDVSNWNVSKVEDMQFMFANCNRFNCDLSNWNLSSIKNMIGMFANCNQFNCDLSNWNIPKTTNIKRMFVNSGLDGKEPNWYKK